MLFCLFLAPTVLHSEGRRVYFSSLSIYYPGFSLAWDGGGDHLLLGISQQVLSLPLSRSAQCSIPLEKSVDNAGPSGRGGGETGSL